MLSTIHLIKLPLCRFKAAPVVLMAAATLLTVTSVHAADGDLHKQIDRLIEARTQDLTFGATAADSEFLRRVYLDLAGRIPSADEVRRFLANTSPLKRTSLIDALLAGPDYPRRMQELFHVMLMERRGEHDDWTRFLRTAFEQNLPWHQIAAAILKPNADSEDFRGAAFFQTQRLVKEGAMAPVDVPGLTRDVGRLFAGIDLQCAQCHDHLTVNDYSQQDFQGLHMVFENVDIRRDVKFPAIGEKLMTDQKEFSSVFEQVAIKTNPVVPGGNEIAIATFEKEQQYIESPDRKKRTTGVPRFSPLTELSSGLASPYNELFCRNIVNRLWFMMMGRGLVEPLDLHHADNPATHPELLELLGHEFAAHDFNIRWLLRELALSKTYQRSTSLPDGEAVPSRASYAVALEKRISAEQLFWSVGVACGEFEAVRFDLRAADDSADGAAESEDTSDAATDNVPPSPDGRWTAEQLVEKSETLAALQKQLQSTFGNPPKEPEVDFTPTVAGALFLMHSEDVRRLLQPRPGNLNYRLSQLESDDEIVDELFLCVLSRQPSPTEVTDVRKYLKSNDDRRTERLANLTWALLTSTEFMVNH
ncbi:MAG TPA: DUF1553 domain-containing protein [Fuerstia sp.]|nr:DUF1553 domain-containing protein [Fuerstiella sp.]